MSEPLSQRQSSYCYRCGHLWFPKGDAPSKRCPRCHSSRWDVPEKKLRACKFCGAEYLMETAETPCPGCGRMQTESISERILRCNQCDYEWSRRSGGTPKKCPLCHSTEWNRPKAERLMCQQCGHLWRRQKTRPQRCPSCQSRLWDQPMRAVRCQRCGHVWRMGVCRSDTPQSICPGCKTSKWNEAAMVRSRGLTLQRYTKVKSPESVELMVCAGCSHRWYVRNAGPVSCPRCGREVSFHDRVASTSMTMWSGDGMELSYVSENGFGCVYLWRDGVPVAARYAHEVLRRFGITISELVKSVNAGQMRDECRLLALDMLEHSEDYVRFVDYFMKRLSLGEDDARILAVHFTGMGPEAIAIKFSLSDEQVRTAFDRIMAAYADSGIIVDDTIFTEDPFRFYGDT